MFALSGLKKTSPVGSQMICLKNNILDGGKKWNRFKNKLLVACFVEKWDENSSPPGNFSPPSRRKRKLVKHFFTTQREITLHSKCCIEMMKFNWNVGESCGGKISLRILKYFNLFQFGDFMLRCWNTFVLAIWCMKFKCGSFCGR